MYLNANDALCSSMFLLYRLMPIYVFDFNNAIYSYLYTNLHQQYMYCRVYMITVHICQYTNTYMYVSANRIIDILYIFFAISTNSMRDVFVDYACILLYFTTSLISMFHCRAIKLNKNHFEIAFSDVIFSVLCVSELFLIIKPNLLVL